MLFRMFCSMTVQKCFRYARSGADCPQRPCSSRCGLAPRARARQNKKGTPLDAPFPGDHPCDVTPLPRARQHRTPASVDSVLQRLARLEARDAGSGDLNGLSSLGIAAHARCPLLDRKAAKAYEGDLAATFQGLGKRFDRSAEHTSELQSRGHLV